MHLGGMLWAGITAATLQLIDIISHLAGIYFFIFFLEYFLKQHEILIYFYTFSRIKTMAYFSLNFVSLSS